MLKPLLSVVNAGTETLASRNMFLCARVKGVYRLRAQPYFALGNH
jgi:hypothetical protein